MRREVTRPTSYAVALEIDNPPESVRLRSGGAKDSGGSRVRGVPKNGRTERLGVWNDFYGDATAFGGGAASASLAISTMKDPAARMTPTTMVHVKNFMMLLPRDALRSPPP